MRKEVHRRGLNMLLHFLPIALPTPNCSCCCAVSLCASIMDLFAPAEWQQWDCDHLVMQHSLANYLHNVVLAIKWLHFLACQCNMSWSQKVWREPLTNWEVGLMRENNVFKTRVIVAEIWGDDFAAFTMMPQVVQAMSLLVFKSFWLVLPPKILDQKDWHHMELQLNHMFSKTLCNEKTQKPFNPVCANLSKWLNTTEIQLFPKEA